MSTFTFPTSPSELTTQRAAITDAYRKDESECLSVLIQAAELPEITLKEIESTATKLVISIREERFGKGGLDAFLSEYDLSTEEGIALMCLAESMLRVNDTPTLNRLIQDKITSADWDSHQGKSDSRFVNAASWALMLTGKILSADQTNSGIFSNTLKRFVKHTSEPVIRKAVGEAMRILGKQFVMGRTIDEALSRSRTPQKAGYRFSYDMLGEAAHTAEDADRYFKAYQNAITAIGKAAHGKQIYESGGISVKLSALHPRYEFAQQAHATPVLINRLRMLALQAKAVDIGLTVDAEESGRLEMSLDIMEAVMADPALKGWNGFGLALQAYQKRAFYVIDWLASMAKKYHCRLMLRLVKGAYWDTEIKDSQVRGLAEYPVFTRKASTDVSYLACAKKIIEYGNIFYPQFATHNAYTVAAILAMMGERRDFEFQCLKGMGLELYDQIVGNHKVYPSDLKELGRRRQGESPEHIHSYVRTMNSVENDPRTSKPAPLNDLDTGTTGIGIACRIYAPVGQHEDLLPYLVRRLLENGANSSFVNRIIDEKTPIQDLIAHPVEKVKNLESKPHPKIKLPSQLYSDRVNSQGLDLTDSTVLKELTSTMDKAMTNTWYALPTVIPKPDTLRDLQGQPVLDPTDHTRQIGIRVYASKEELEKSILLATKAAPAWNATPIEQRAACLERLADLLETNRAELMAMLVKEGGKCIPDALGELREAVDFCRYYAALGRTTLSPLVLAGPTGEFNQLELHGRGVFFCISPWNFPLAIFTGQVVAALMSGNCVLAKPAEQTTLIGAKAVELMHQAGIPKEVVQLVTGKGSVIGPITTSDNRVNGIMFTGSTETARGINQTLAQRSGPIVPFIAETGGQNALIADSTALPEQLVSDVIVSAFNSAGQRCSALRVLFLQEEMADRVIKLLKGAMQELKVGDPAKLSTDIGPVIDENSRKTLEAHAERMNKEGKLIAEVALSPETRYGTFFAPRAYEIKSLNVLEGEVFGPILHVIRYKSTELDAVIDAINTNGYGLTLGIHTRIKATADYILQRVRVGNRYVNRNMIGAVVGVQPFGGEGLSGTGPKAGGPHYLARLCNERSLAENTTAAGGNASLISLEE